MLIIFLSIFPHDIVLYIKGDLWSLMVKHKMCDLNLRSKFARPFVFVVVKRLVVRPLSGLAVWSILRGQIHRGLPRPPQDWVIV